MAVIAKDSKISINGEEARWVAFPNAAVINDEDINVWGYNEKGEFWFQLEHGEDINEPYLNEWWYKVTLDECTEDNYNAPKYWYKWLYRCIQECYEVEKRTIYYNGMVTTFSTLGNGVLYIAAPAYKDTIHSNNAGGLLNRVLDDTTPLMSQFYVGQSQMKNDTIELSCPANSSEMARRQAIVDASVREVDDIIYNLYGFTTDNKPTAVDDKVKVAKVIHDWLKINNIYGEDNEWEEQSIYAALSKGEYTPVCTSYAMAAHFLLSRYGIENIVCTGKFSETASKGHVWNIVNYHDECGMFTENAEQWCLLDCTDNVNDTLNWHTFNTVSSGEVYGLTTQKYPVSELYDGEHKYTGNKQYEW